MNENFKAYHVDLFIIVFIDNILMYSSRMNMKCI